MSMFVAAQWCNCIKIRTYWMRNSWLLYVIRYSEYEIINWIDVWLQKTLTSLTWHAGTCALFGSVICSRLRLNKLMIALNSTPWVLAQPHVSNTNISDLVANWLFENFLRLRQKKLRSVGQDEREKNFATWLVIIKQCFSLIFAHNLKQVRSNWTSLWSISIVKLGFMQNDNLSVA